MRKSTEHTYRARWIIPLAGPPIFDGFLSVHGGRIADVGTSKPDGVITDLGDAVIIPALVNAHTHLEFSNLTAPIGNLAMSFTEWIKRVVTWRRERDTEWDQSRGASPAHVTAIRAGINECLRTGTGVLGEIATSPTSVTELESSSLRGVAFLEMIGWSAANISPLMEAARTFISNSRPDRPDIVRGISPHAPYTVHQDLLRAIVRESAQTGFPIAMHLAETPAELELLATGTGPFAEMMQALPGWAPSVVIANSRPMDYLQILSAAERVLVIHGNYLDQREIEFLAEHRANMSVVYCPRTHQFFGHRDYPLEQMLAAGVRVALGTDSRASNPDLNLLNEIRFAARRHPNIAPETWLKIATLYGAEALGMDRYAGSLRVGNVGKFLVIPLSADQRDDPWSWLFDEERQPLIVTNEY